MLRERIPINALKVFTGDIDGDGRGEFVLIGGSFSEIFCFDVYDGAWYKYETDDTVISIKLSDINHDGKDEILVRSFRKLFLLSLQ